MQQENRVLVIGAGPAGIASAVALKDAGLTPVVLDQADRIASSWRSRYDGLRLNTWRRFSHLPGRPFAEGNAHVPQPRPAGRASRAPRRRGRDRAAPGHASGAIERGDGDWVVHTDAGAARANQVVVATGYEQNPLIPGLARARDLRG